LWQRNRNNSALSKENYVAKIRTSSTSTSPPAQLTPIPRNPQRAHHPATPTHPLKRTTTPRTGPATHELLEATTAAQLPTAVPLPTASKAPTALHNKHLTTSNLTASSLPTVSKGHTVSNRWCTSSNRRLGGTMGINRGDRRRGKEFAPAFWGPWLVAVVWIFVCSKKQGLETGIWVSFWILGSIGWIWGSYLVMVAFHMDNGSMAFYGGDACLRFCSRDVRLLDGTFVRACVQSLRHIQHAHGGCQLFALNNMHLTIELPTGRHDQGPAAPKAPP
jgi:hypothetical protein